MFERRRDKRMVIADEEIVVMGLHSNSVGILKDISLGGMKFEYFAEKPADGQWKIFIV